jgi:hypothetical protein
MNAKSNHNYVVTFSEHDQKMKEAFKFAGMVNRVSDNFLKEIENHKHVIYISGNGGSLEKAEHIAQAGLAVLKAGGLGIKIETAGKAFEKAQWIDFFNDFDVATLYKMFVVDSISENGTTYSCGMQNLGFKDSIISDEDFQESVKLIAIFSYYQIIDKPAIQNNQTFSCDIDSPKFRITSELNPPYAGHELFGNPFGMWRLSRV